VYAVLSAKKLLFFLFIVFNLNVTVNQTRFFHLFTGDLLTGSKKIFSPSGGALLHSCSALLPA
jgi:hypothetical protein